MHSTLGPLVHLWKAVAEHLWLDREEADWCSRCFPNFYKPEILWECCEEKYKDQIWAREAPCNLRKCRDNLHGRVRAERRGLQAQRLYFKGLEEHVQIFKKLVEDENGIGGGSGGGGEETTLKGDIWRWRMTQLGGYIGMQQKATVELKKKFITYKNFKLCVHGPVLAKVSSSRFSRWLWAPWDRCWDSNSDPRQGQDDS